MQGYALQGWFAADITNNSRRGLGSWSVDDIVTYLKTGHNQTSIATGLMSETSILSTSHMTDADLRAIAVYLKDQPGRDASAPDAGPAGDESRRHIYADQCSGCAAATARGPLLFPALNGSAVVQQADPTSLMHVVLRGSLSVGTDKAPTAPPCRNSAGCSRTIKSRLS